uniref:Transmembrane protein 144 n=1 Tax=Globodera pallida TaxID=36090 RepID=A0A183BVJ1_GLOPA
MLSDLFTNFVLKKGQRNGEVVDGKNGDNNAVNKHKRGRRGIITGAGINAYIVAGREGSSTAAALLVDAKVVDWSLTAPLPGLQLHWLHINHSIMLGKYNIGMSLTTGILVIFILVSMLYWWHALKLSVYLAILYGDNAGWACIFVATIFYIILCVGFVIG